MFEDDKEPEMVKIGVFLNWYPEFHLNKIQILFFEKVFNSKYRNTQLFVKGIYFTAISISFWTGKFTNLATNIILKIRGGNCKRTSI